MYVSATVFTTFLLAVRVSVKGRCHVWHWLSEFSGVVLSCFTISFSTIFTDVTLIKPVVQLTAQDNSLFSVIGQEACPPLLSGTTASAQRDRGKRLVWRVEYKLNDPR